jgi:hypothetical protein
MLLNVGQVLQDGPRSRVELEVVVVVKLFRGTDRRQRSEIQQSISLELSQTNQEKRAQIFPAKNSSGKIFPAKNSSGKIFPAKNFPTKNISRQKIFRQNVLMIWTSDFNALFQIKLVNFIKTEKLLYSDKCTSLLRNRPLKSEV